MTMYEQSQQSDWLQTELESMSLQAASPAKTSQSRDTSEALRQSVVDCGQSAPVCLGSFDLDTPSLKTSQTCLMENGELGLSEFFGTFPRSGMMRNGTVYQLPNLARTITEIASGLWPTPRAQEAKHAAPTEWEMNTEHAGTQGSLRVQVNKRSFYWRTPDIGGGGTPKAILEGRTHRESGQPIQVRLSDQVKMWPTPRASEYKGVGPLDSKSHKHMLEKRYLCAVAQETEGVTGSLNPTWVEWLMGFPLGHTDLNA